MIADHDIEGAALSVIRAMSADMDGLGEAVNDLTANGASFAEIAALIDQAGGQIIVQHRGSITGLGAGADRHTRRRLAKIENVVISGWQAQLSKMKAGARRALAVNASAQADILAALS